MKACPAAGAPAPAGHELRRERLLDALQRHGSRPLILLIAPAGFGKTTLAAAYARDRGGVAVWLPLRLGDEDPRTLFDRLRLAFELTLGPAATPALARGLAQGADGSGLARLLVNDIGALPRPFVLVLDDFHLVQETEAVQTSIDLLLRGMPEGGQLVIATREPPSLSIEGLVAEDRVLVFGPDDLRFTPHEAAELRARVGGDASRDAIAEGWVAGILLGGAPHQLGAADGSLVDTYVRREVLGRLPAVARRWLQTLALIDSITADRAARLLGPGPWPARLAALANRCPFLVADATGGYRLHALVREALTRRARRGNVEHARRAWLAVRALAEADGDVPAAVQACQELGEFDAAASLISRTVDDALRAGRWTPALATIALLPEQSRADRPLLALAEAHALVQSGQPAVARQVAERALEHGGRTGSLAIQVRALIELANVARYTGDIDAARDWLTAADHLLLAANLPARERRLLNGRLLGLRGVCAAVSGDAEAARGYLESAERALLPDGTSRELAVVQYNLGTFCVRTGDYATARVALAAASTHWRLLGDRGMLATTQLVLGNLHLRTGELNAAGASVARSLEAARLAGALRTEAHGLVAEGALHRGYGRLADAATSLGAAITLAREIGERELLVRALTQRVEVAVLAEDVRSARDLLASAHTEAQRLESRVERAIVSRALARVRLAEGAPHAAIDAVREALHDGAGAWGPDERLIALYWLGTAHLVAGQLRRAEDALRQALQLANAVAGRAVLAGPAAEDRRLLEYGRQLGLEAPALADIDRLAAGRRAWTTSVVTDATATDARHDVHLEVRLFGGLRVYRDATVFDASGKRDRARELLALLALAPEGLPAREIADLLNPGMAPERAQHNLRMTVYLLRRWLGGTATVRHATLAYSLSPRLDLWVDSRAFDAAIARSRGGVGASSVQALEEALELYRGPLLADTGWQWVAPFRDRFARQATDAALRLADLLSASEPARSDALAEGVLATLDPDNLDAFERLIRNAVARHDQRAHETAIRRYPALAARLRVAPRHPVVRAI